MKKYLKNKVTRKLLSFIIVLSMLMQSNILVQNTSAAVSRTGNQTMVDADYNPRSIDWSAINYLTGTAEKQYKAVVASGTVQEIVNVQKPGWATEEGIYISFNNVDFGEMTVNGKALSKTIEGAGILLHLSNFKDMYSTIVINNKDGSQKAVIYVYNSKGNNNTETPIETTKIPETTTVPETTTIPETTTKGEITTSHPIKNPGVQFEEPDSDVAENVSLNKYILEIDKDFSSTEGNKNNNEGIEKLFDNNINTKFFTNDAPVISIAWKMKRATILKTYTLVTANDAAAYSHRNPHKWKLYGSVNGTDWSQLDSVENGGIGHENLKAYTYETDVKKACQFYMLKIEDSGDDGKLYYGSQLAEMYLNGDVVRLSTDIGVDLQKHVKGINTNATTVKGFNDREGVENLFDGDISTKLFTTTGTPCSIAWTMKEKNIII